VISLLPSFSRDVVTFIKSDSAGYNHSAIRSALATLTDPAADYLRINDYWPHGHGDSAIILLDSLPLKYTIDTLTDSSFISQQAHISFRKQLMDDSLAISTLDSTHVAALNNIAVNGYGLGARKAQGLLHFFYGYPYKSEAEAVVTTSGGGGSAMAKAVSAINKLNGNADSAENGYIKAYPNPTNGLEYFELGMPVAHCQNACCPRQHHPALQHLATRHLYMAGNR
jgi:hypothetical protein